MSSDPIAAANVACDAALKKINDLSAFLAARSDAHEALEPLAKLLRERIGTPKPKLYLAGPMTGYPEQNFPAFHAAAAQLRTAGYEVVNPAELNLDPGTPWRVCMQIDIRELVLCEGIALLPAWERSKGALLEYRIARGLDMQVERVEGWLNKLPAATADTGPDTAGGELWSV